MSSLSSFLPLLFLLPGLATAATPKCYGLDGTELDKTFAPCNPSARHSGCCATRRPAGSVDICLDNGLCMATNDKYMGTIWQDGCTDPTGRDPSCPRLCPDVTDNFNGLKPVLAWNIQMCDYGSYCCREVDDNRNCCNNATAPKIKTNSLGAFQFQTSTAGASTLSSSSRPTFSAATPVANKQEPTSIFATAVSTGEPFSQATSTSIPVASSISNCPADKSPQVGGAVGGTLSLVIVGLLGIVFWMFKREQHQRKVKEHYEEQFGQNFAYRRTIVLETDPSAEVRMLASAPSVRSLDEKSVVDGMLGR